MDNPKALITRNFRIGRDLDNPDIAIVQLAADAKGEVVLTFAADASMLDELASALTEAAKQIRKRSN